MESPTRVDLLDVLIVVEDQDMSDMVQDVLRSDETQNFSARCERSARGGLDAYDRRPSDVVVLGLGPRDASGAEPLLVLRELLERHPQPCVIVLSAGPSQLGREALYLGAQDYLERSETTSAQLCNAVRFAVERHAHTIRTVPPQALQAADRAASHPAQRGDADRLREPLATLTQALETLCVSQLQDRDERAKLLNRSLCAAYALGRKIDQVIDAQRRVQERDPVDLHALANAVAQDLGDLAMIMGSSIVIDRLPLLWGHEQLLRLLLRNLIANALEHGGPGVHVRISSIVHPRGMRLLVDDDGPGIPARSRSALFHAPEPGASGFGLRACAAVATAHGGRCWVEDSPLGGSRAVVELPTRRWATPPPDL